MKIENTTIILRQVRFFARHGVFPQEQATGANFFVSLEAETDFRSSLMSDELTDTVSYGDLFEVIREEMAVPSKLLEHLAGRIAQKILTRYPEVRKIKLEITKENPPMGADAREIGISIVASQD